jgi:catechol 2,3-dioxygenase-like lactoylglutathione lyase family enzyme
MNPYARILGLHHVQVTVPPPMEQAAVRFYRDALGLSEVRKPAELGDRGGTWFAFPNGQQLHLGIEADVNRRATKAHVAYEVDDLGHWRQRMLDHEVTPVETIPLPGYDRFEARDPFGNRIEFIARIG